MAPSRMLLKLIWVIVVPQAPGQRLGAQAPSLPAPVSAVQGKASAKSPIFPQPVCNGASNSLPLPGR